MLNLSQIEETFDKKYLAQDNGNTVTKTGLSEIWASDIKQFYREHFTKLLKSLKPRNMVDPEGYYFPIVVDFYNDLAKEQREKIDQALK